MPSDLTITFIRLSQAIVDRAVHSVLAYNDIDTDKGPIEFPVNRRFLGDITEDVIVQFNRNATAVSEAYLELTGEKMAIDPRDWREVAYACRRIAAELFNKTPTIRPVFSPAVEEALAP
jgi:hypothetical protein